MRKLLLWSPNEIPFTSLFKNYNSSGMVQTENGLQIDCLEIRKGQNESDKNTVSFHPAISFPPLYPRALRKGVWKIRKSGIWNPESGI